MTDFGSDGRPPTVMSSTRTDFARPRWQSAAQFRKGESGNRKGRPNGTKNLRTDLIEELRETITVRDGERTMTISKQRGIVKSLVARTLNGDARAAAALLAIMIRVLKVDQDVEAGPSELSREESEALAALERRLLGAIGEAVEIEERGGDEQEAAESNDE